MTFTSSDLHDYYRNLRASDPVHWNASLNMWTLTGQADIATALLHRDLSSQRPHPNLSHLGKGAEENAQVVYDTIATWLLRLDASTHRRLRSVAARALRDSIDATAGERIAQTANKLLDRVSPLRGMEVITDFAAPLSLTAIATIVGVPSSDHGRFYEWASAVGAAAEAVPEPLRLELAFRSLTEATAYLRQLVSKRIAHPEADFISGLLRGSVDSKPRSLNAIVGLSVLLMLAGHDTTTHLIGNGILALLQNPAQLVRLQQAPTPTAVQEMLRYATPLHGVLRMAAQDLDLGDKHILKGQAVAIWLAAGNRDPACFNDPERFDIGRTPNPHFAFGHGVHHCLGASLGRLIAETAITQTVKRYPHLHLATERLDLDGNFLFRGLRSLRVRF